MNNGLNIFQELEVVVLSYSFRYYASKCDSCSRNKQKLALIQLTQLKKAFVQTMKFSVFKFPCAHREMDWYIFGILWLGFYNHQGYLAFIMTRFAPLAVYCFNVQVQFESHVLRTMIKVNGEFMSLRFIDHECYCSWACDSSIHLQKEYLISININCEIQSIVSFIESLIIKKIPEFSCVFADLMMNLQIDLYILKIAIPSLIPAIPGWIRRKLFMAYHISNERTNKSTCACGDCTDLKGFQVTKSSNFEYFTILKVGFEGIIVTIIKYKHSTNASNPIFILDHNFRCPKVFCDLLQLLIALYLRQDIGDEWDLCLLQQLHYLHFVLQSSIKLHWSDPIIKTILLAQSLSLRIRDHQNDIRMLIFTLQVLDH